jgi:hypothetical protein
MSKSDTQWEFLKCLADLIHFAELGGYKFTMSRGYASEAANAADGGHPESCHLHRLAIDLNLFVDGEYITGDHPVWNELGEYWESLHPLACNGRTFNDHNHFSFMWNGVK